MGVTTTNNKPLNPRGNDQSPLAYNRAALYSGKALSFDGVNDYVDCGSIEVQSFSLITNVYFDLLSNTDTLAGNWDSSNGFMLYKNSSNNMFVYINSAKVQTDISEYVGHWTQFVATYDGTTAKLYANGVLINSEAYAATINYSSGSTFKVGAYGNTPGGLLNGDVAGTKIFNTALTAAQIADLYNFPEKIVPTGVDNTALKLWLPMMEGAGTTAYDGSGNGNHGTIAGATYVNGVGAPVAQTSVIDWNKGSNLAKFSEEFDNADWTTGGASIISNQTTSPNGILNADKFIESAALGIHVVNNSSPITGTATSTASVFYKKGTRRYFSIKLQIGGSSYTQVFDSEGLVTGSNYSNGLTNVVTTIEDYGNGWGRFSIKGTSPSGVFTYAIFALSDSLNPTFDAGNFNPKYTGTGTDYGYFWGAQVNAGSVGPYIPTLSTAQPTPVLLPAGLTTGRDITGVNLFENVRKQGALNLDGLSFAEVHKNDSVPEGGEDRTMEVWVYHKPQTTYQSFIELGEMTNYKRFAILSTSISAGNRIYIAGQGYDTNTNVSYNTNAWNHIVVTLESGAQKVYKNGASISDLARPSYNTTLDTIEIGRNKQNLTEYSYSTIAQPRIYNRALTAEEVQRNYNAGKNIYS